MSRPRVLFIAPTMPAEGGNGLAMRAGLFLDALSRGFDVTLLVVPVSMAASSQTPIPDFVRMRSRRALILPIEGREDPHFALIMRLKDAREREIALARYPAPLRCRYSTPSLVRDAQAAVAADGPFDAVHVMRLYLAPFADPHLRQKPHRPLVTLDLDDMESETHDRLAKLWATVGKRPAARRQRIEASRFAAMERERLPGFDRVFLCSADDSLRVARMYEGVRSEVAPNAIALPATLPPRPHAYRFDCLFVGTFGYFPNADAVLHFCGAILPELRRQAGREVTLAIVGSNPPSEVRALSRMAGVTVTGPVPDVGPYYADAAMAIIPLRAGGGTRIKVLEAFAHGVPVVSTPIGCEGIEAVHDRHLLLADAPDAFAAACHRLLDDTALARRLGASGWRLAGGRYASEAAACRIGEIFSAALTEHLLSDPA